MSHLIPVVKKMPDSYGSKMFGKELEELEDYNFLCVAYEDSKTHMSFR